MGFKNDAISKKCRLKPVEETTKVNSVTQKVHLAVPRDMSLINPFLTSVYGEIILYFFLPHGVSARKTHLQVSLLRPIGSLLALFNRKLLYGTQYTII